jgi:hypothetical protein
VTVATKDHEAQLLAKLGGSAEWQALRERAERAMRHRGEILAQQFLRRNHRPDYEQLQWERGVFAGIKFLLDHPTMEAQRLERLLERDQTREDVTESA